MKRSFFLIIGLISASIFTIHAERYYYFDHVTTKDGLPSNTIYCTLQDRTGFMWIGTRDGLSRYDGNNFSNIRDMVDADGLGGNIYSICEDSEGKIWFSNPSGIHIYDPATGKIIDLEIVEGSASTSMMSDQKGHVWILTDKLIRLECGSLDFKEYDFPHLRPSSMAVDSYGSIWVSMHDGNIYIYDTRTDRFEPRECGHWIRRICSAEEGKLLAVTAFNEVVYLD